MSKRPLLRLVPLCDVEDFQAALYDDENVTLAELLQGAPALSTEPLAPDWLQRPLHQLIITPVAAGPEVALYRPAGLTVGRVREPAPPAAPVAVAALDRSAQALPSPPATAPETVHPETLSEADAVRLAYGREIDQVASFLRSGLSVLVICDKLVVEHLWQDMARRAGLRDLVLAAGDEDEAAGLMPRSLRQRQLAQLKELSRSFKRGDVVVIPHLDLLAGGGDRALSNETREFIERVYGTRDCLMLAFADRTLELPEVLAARFAVRVLISGLPRSVIYPDGREQWLGQALVTTAEAGRFGGFSAEGLYKNVAGMNAVQLRHALAYAVKEHPAGAPVERLYQAIRAFKA